MADIPRLLVVILTSFIIFALSIALIRRKGAANPNSPSSFFSLDELVSKPAFYLICLFFSGTISVLYAAIALDSGNLLSAIQGYIRDYATNSAKAELKPALEALFSAIPTWIEPLFVFLAFIFLFGDKVQTWLTYLRDSIVKSSGLYTLIDGAAISTADLILNETGRDYDKAVSKLENLKGECPVPEELVSRKDSRRLAYQIIWSVRDTIVEDGFTESNNNLKVQLGLSARDHIRIQFVRVIAAATMYAVLMTLFVVFIPLFGNSAQRIGIYWTDFFGCLRLMLKFTLAFTLPLLLAVSIYPLRRRAYHATETPFQSMSTVAAMQFILSFSAQQMYNLIETTIRLSAGEPNSLLEAKTHVLAFLNSLIPMLAFLAILSSRHLKKYQTTSALLICLLSALAFSLSDFVFEIYNNKIDYFFIHQFIFGFWITFSFLTYGLIRRN